MTILIIRVSASLDTVLAILATSRATMMGILTIRVSALDRDYAHPHDIFLSQGKAAHEVQLHNRGRGYGIRIRWYRHWWYHHLWS